MMSAAALRTASAFRRRGLRVHGEVVKQIASPGRELRLARVCRTLHDDKAGAFQMLHKALGDDLRRDFVRVMHALAALERHRCRADRRQGAKRRIAREGPKLLQFLEIGDPRVADRC
jgi:hypothetical protein